MNLKIKFRESFRPFAPSVLADRASDYFDMPRGSDSPYMLVVAPVKANQRVDDQGEGDTLFGIDKLKVPRSTIPAVTHVDGSARVQTVDDARNPLYARLLRAFERQTGCPLLINTSFNVRGEPIVESPADAYRGSSPPGSTSSPSAISSSRRPIRGRWRPPRSRPISRNSRSTEAEERRRLDHDPDPLEPRPQDPGRVLRGGPVLPRDDRRAARLFPGKPSAGGDVLGPGGRAPTHRPGPAGLAQTDLPRAHARDLAGRLGRLETRARPALLPRLHPDRPLVPADRSRRPPKKPDPQAETYWEPYRPDRGLERYLRPF